MVFSGSAIEKAGIRKGDIITHIDGQSINSTADLVLVGEQLTKQAKQAIEGSFKKTISIILKRGESTETVSVIF